MCIGGDRNGYYSKKKDQKQYQFSLKENSVLVQLLLKLSVYENGKGSMDT